MAEHIKEDELQPEQTEGFKVGEKKTLDEYEKLDAEDDAMRKWKASLGLGTGTPLLDEKDPRTCIILSLGLEVPGREDIILDLRQPGQLAALKDKPFTIKEGAQYRVKVKFRVQRQLLSGLKYLQVVKRAGLSQKEQEMIGSYGPSTKENPEYEKKFESQEAPSGMLARGHYKAVSRFIDDDKQEHLRFEWSFDIKKDW